MPALLTPSQTEITAPLQLLDSQGHQVHPGWARSPFWRYDRNAVVAPRWRIKEWDYYSVLSPAQGFGVALTVADLGYVGLLAVCYFDFERAFFHQVERLLPIPLGRMGLGADSERGAVHVQSGAFDIGFTIESGTRRLLCRAPGMRNAQGQRGLVLDVTLHQSAALESMNITSAWADQPRAFYYNRKINAMPAQGGFQIGDHAYTFDQQRDFGALDWGRGHWPWRCRWYWSSASGFSQGRRVGWNLGYGFSDRRAASENALIVDGVLHKLGEVRFDFDPDRPLLPWRFHDGDGRIDLKFTPVLDRHSQVHLGLIRTVQHQVFGHFDGCVRLDDGSEVPISHLLGFAEDVLNWW